MPTIYVYTRVSTPDQAAAIAMQNRIALAHMKYVIDRDTANNNGVERDWKIVKPMEEKASAFKLRFQQRPMGKLLCAMLNPGDHVVFARFDRYVRLTKDHVLQTEEFTKNGVTIHFADMNVTMGTAAGDMMATFFSAIAQYYSQSLSERMKASYRERYVHGTAFPPGRKLLVKEVKRPGKPSLTIANRQTILYLRYIVTLRRRSYLRDGAPMSWGECSDRLERIRAQRGDIPKYRPRWNRQELNPGLIEVILKRLMSSEFPALNSERIVKYFREGLNPFQLGRSNKNWRPEGYKLPIRQRESIFDHLRATNKPLPPKKIKRWSNNFDCCQNCGKTEIEHMSRGLCAWCYRKSKNTKTNSQPANAG